MRGLCFGLVLGQSLEKYGQSLENGKSNKGQSVFKQHRVCIVHESHSKQKTTKSNQSISISRDYFFVHMAQRNLKRTDLNFDHLYILCTTMANWSHDVAKQKMWQNKNHPESDNILTLTHISRRWTKPGNPGAVTCASSVFVRFVYGDNSDMVMSISMAD